jgi:chromosome segregation ATPase
MAPSTLSVIDVYEQLLSAPDDKTRARVIATAFERLEDRYPELKDLATATGVRETELRLLKEIEKIRQETQQIRQETQQIRADMHKFEQQIRADMHQTELRLQKEIAEVHLKIEMTSKKQVQWMVGLFFTFAFTLIAAMFGVSVL